MKYANTKVKVLSKEHLDHIAKVTGMKWNPIWPILVARISEDLVIYFEDDFDKDPDCWGYECLKLSTNTVSDDLTEILIDLPKITPPFKFKNADSPLVREWLKLNGYKYDNEDIDVLKDNLSFKVGRVDPEGFFWVCGDEELPFENYYPDYKEICFDIVQKINTITVKDNNYDIHTKALELVDTMTPYKLARILLENGYKHE